VAKKGFGTAFLAFLGTVIVSSIKEHQKNKAKLEADYKRAYQKEKKNFDQEQAEFDAYVLSLPVLKGDDSFSVATDLDKADGFALKAFTVHLDVMHEIGQPVWVVIYYTGDSEPAGEKLSLQISDAEMGYVAQSEEQSFIAVVQKGGDLVRCAGMLSKAGDGHQLWLDIARPPELVK
jgi:hypothetical protein